MATIAIDWRHGGTGVAKIAGRRCVGACQREASGAVVEDRVKPIRHVMAGIASGRIGQSHMVRNRSAQGCRALIVGVVAADTSSRQRAAVVSTDVAQPTGRDEVRAEQRESGRGMIERRSRPISCRVADRTILREARRNVIRYCAAERRGALPRR